MKIELTLQGKGKEPEETEKETLERQRQQTTLQKVSSLTLQNYFLKSHKLFLSLLNILYFT